VILKIQKKYYELIYKQFFYGLCKYHHKNVPSVECVVNKFHNKNFMTANQTQIKYLVHASAR
jgi:hypothetical protein